MIVSEKPVNLRVKSEGKLFGITRQADQKYYESLGLEPGTESIRIQEPQRRMFSCYFNGLQAAQNLQSCIALKLLPKKFESE